MIDKIDWSILSFVWHTSFCLQQLVDVFLGDQGEKNHSAPPCLNIDDRAFHAHVEIIQCSRSFSNITIKCRDRLFLKRLVNISSKMWTQLTSRRFFAHRGSFAVKWQLTVFYSYPTSMTSLTWINYSSRSIVIRYWFFWMNKIRLLIRNDLGTFCILQKVDAEATTILRTLARHPVHVRNYDSRIFFLFSPPPPPPLV